jgi:hypothetical protein
MNPKKLPQLVFIVLILSSGVSFSQDKVPHYSILEKKDFIILNPDYSVTFKSLHILNIWDSKGLSHAKRVLPVDKLNRVVNFEVTVTNLATSKVVKKVKLKDLKELSYVDEVSTYNDTKYKVFELEGVSLPVKVEIVEERLRTTNFFMGSWDPQYYYNQKIKSASLEVIYPTELGLRYRLNNLDSAKNHTQYENKVTLKWNLENLDAIDENVNTDSIPSLDLAPKKFSLEGYVSDMENWDGFGRFISLLIDEKDELPEDFKPQVREMTAGLEDDYEKISVIYNYLQKNYRYVVIFLGIDGWEPRYAADVIQTKYGECKALSILMKAMLKEVGIDSQYSLVYAGDKIVPLEPDFPINSFNHAFLRVPLGEEHLWLECTNNFLPAGFSGNFTKDRDVLVVTKNGGFLERTPDYREFRFNSIKNQYNIQIQENGDGTFTGNSSFKGFPAVDFFALNQFLDDNQRKNYLNKNIGGSGIIIKEYQIETSTQREVPVASVAFDGNIQRFGQQTTKRIIYPTHIKKIEMDMLNNGFLNLQEEITIKSDRKTEIETGVSNFEIKEDHFSYFIDSQISPDGSISISNRLEITFPKEISEEEKSKTIARINSQLQKNIVLKKSE